jgi:LPXTG-motif cell wall-anchored protein
MTAVFTSNGDSRGRVGGPVISIETCAGTAPTTTPTGTSSAPATTAPAAVLPSSTAPTTAGVLVLAATATSQPAEALPATGGGMSPAAAGAVALVIGAMLVFLTRRRLPSRSSQ